MKKTILLAITLALFSVNNATAQKKSTSKKKATTAKVTSHEGHQYVDLGLSVKWATCNVGANNPWESGNFYAWGETTTKSEYEWSNYFDLNSNNNLSSGEGLNRQIIKNDGMDSFKKYGNGKLTQLALEDDAANVNWGGNWRIPSEKEWQELDQNCRWKVVTKQGVAGFQITSKKNGKSIFLPAPGFMSGKYTQAPGVYGSYWMNSIRDDRPSWAFVFCFGNDNKFWNHNDRFYRCNGRSVRAVCP